MKSRSVRPLLAAVGLWMAACTQPTPGLDLTMSNHAPVAAITVDDANPLMAATTVTFNASATDAEGDPLTYSWNFGDGTPPQTGQIVTHAYQVAGQFNVVLTVADNRGSNTSVNTTINARRLTGIWFSRARAWYFEIAHTGPTLVGRLTGFRDVTLQQAVPLFGVVRHPHAVAFDVPGGISFAGVADPTANQMIGTLNEGSRRFGEVLVRQN